MRTETFDDTQWQIVPRKATQKMLMDLKPHAGDIVQMIREKDGLKFSCDFGLAYRLLLASAPAFPSGERR